MCYEIFTTKYFLQEPLPPPGPGPRRGGHRGASRAGSELGPDANVESVLGPAVDDVVWRRAAQAAAASGLRSSASAQPKIVTGRLRSWNRRCKRQKPTRLPYSNMPSAARSRPDLIWFRPCASVRPFSVTPSHGTNDVIVIKDAFKSCIEFLDRLISTKHFRAERAPKCVLISIKDFFSLSLLFLRHQKEPFWWLL